jgi:hypothetical protein
MPGNKEDSFSIDLSSVGPVEFVWAHNTDVTTGIIAQTMPYTNMASSITSPVTIDQLTTRLEKLEKIMLEEAKIRHNHPAVKTAYDEYKFLLELAKSPLTDE